MAESYFQYLIKKHRVEYALACASAAAHTDEIGNPPHRGTREILSEHGIPLVPHRARLLTREDGVRFDYLIGMDEWNRRDILRIIGSNWEKKVHLLLDFTPSPRDVADPWYMGDFRATYSDIEVGCNALFEALKARLSLS